MSREHETNRRESNREKHENAQAKKRAEKKEKTGRFARQQRRRTRLPPRPED
jgi:hypothetical protein